MNKVNFRGMKITHVRILFVFGVIALGIYGYSLGNSFIFDDEHVIVRNVFIRNFIFFPYYLKGYITSVTVKARGIRPLLMLTFNLNYMISGYNPWSYRLLNMIIHILNAWLIYLIFLKLFPGVKVLISIFTGLLFLIHPINVEAVTYLSSRSDLLVTLFVLLSFYYFLLFEEKYKVRRYDYHCIFTKFYILSIVWFLAALLTKGFAISLPLFLASYVFIYHKRKNLKEKLMIVIPFILVLFLYIGYGSWLYGSKVLGIENGKYFWLNMLTEAKVVFYYLRLFIWPDKLSIDHQDIIIHNPYKFIFLLLLATVTVIIFGLRKENKIKLCWGWYILFLLPKFVINLKFPAMEHHFYLPSVGIYMGIGLLLDKLSLLFPSMIWGGFLILCCIIGKITFLRSCVFQDEESVLESAVKVNPRAVYSIYRLGVTYEKKREYKKALDVLNSIFTAGAPRKIVVQSLVQIADIYRVLKNYSQAENLTLCALKLSPDYSPGFHQLGLIFLDKSKSAQAKIYFDKELKNAADKKGCLIRIAKAFYRHGNYELAIAYCRLLKQLDPSDYRVYLQLAEILESKGRIQEALHYYQRAVDLHPLSYSLHFKLGTLYALKRDKRAEKEFKFALQLNPRASEVYYNLGLFYLLQSKDLNPARKYLRKAQKMGYKLPEAIIKFLNYD